MIDITNNISLPKKTKDLNLIEEGLNLGGFEFGFRERILFPLSSQLSFYEEHYDDIRLEYLVDFKNSSEDFYVFNPEYRTLAREVAYTQFDSVSNYDFYYLQDTLSFTTPERTNLIEDRVFGLCTVNPTDEDDAWEQLQSAATKCLRNVRTNGAIMRTPTTDGNIIYYLDGQKVGFGKDEREKGFMSIHFSIQDIHKTLNKKR